MNEVEAVFPRSVGGEIYAMFQTLQSLPSEAKPEISAHLGDKIHKSLEALQGIKDNPGNIDAYFHIGVLYSWDFQRVFSAGTVQERTHCLMATYQSSDRGLIMGMPKIIRYFLERYVSGGGNDPNCLAVVNSIISKIPTS